MKHAVYCATRNLYEQMETAAKSLVANSDVGKVHFLIEDAEFPRPLPDIVECHDVSGQEFFDEDGPNMRCHWTWMVLMRSALCHLLQDVDVVLSLDCDTIAVGDASGAWDTPLDGCYFAAVKEKAKSKHGLQYMNFGVALLNLEKLRDGKADEAISVINSCKYTWPEQDVMNYLCQGRIREMPKKYNDMSFNGSAEDPAIIHYAAMANDKWPRLPEPSKYREMSWDEAMRLHRYAKCKPVLFASNHGLDRDESLRAVWDAYDGPKEFVKPVEAIANAKDYPVVVVDTLTPYVPGKDFKLVNIGHGITGGKLYGRDEQRAGIDENALTQTDYAISTSTKTVDIVAKQFGIPANRVLPFGFPRADWYAGKKKGDGCTFMAKYKRAYLYAPTFRGKNDGEKLPAIDWEKIDSMLEDDEVVVVKRHYFTRSPLVTQDVEKVIEIPIAEGIAPYLIDCDVLLTDYSSTLFDAYMLSKPSVLAVDDMDAYLETRGMYLRYPNDYSSRWVEAEGNEEKLLSCLRAACVTGMRHAERKCIDYVADMCDGHAAERVCEFVRSMAYG